ETLEVLPIVRPIEEPHQVLLVRSVLRHVHRPVWNITLRSETPAMGVHMAVEETQVCALAVSFSRLMQPSKGPTYKVNRVDSKGTGADGRLGDIQETKVTGRVIRIEVFPEHG